MTDMNQIQEVLLSGDSDKLNEIVKTALTKSIKVSYSLSTAQT